MILKKYSLFLVVVVGILAILITFALLHSEDGSLWDGWGRSLAALVSYLDEQFNISGCNETIANNHAQLSLNLCKGTYTALTYRGSNWQIQETPVLSFKLISGGYRDSSAVEVLGNNEYLVRFANSDLTAKIRITPQTGYFTFRLLSVSSYDNIDEVELYHFVGERAPFVWGPIFPDNGRWARLASDDELFLNTLPLSVNTDCGFYPTGGGPYQWGLRLRCKGSRFMNLQDVVGALVTVPKSEYFKATEQVVAESGLPYSRLSDGRWHRVSREAREPYLFSALNETNSFTARLPDLAVRGNFPQMVLIHPFTLGLYDKPRPEQFPSCADVSSFDQCAPFQQAVAAFRAKNIKVGMHTFFNQVEPADCLENDPNHCLVNFRSPKPGELRAGLMHLAAGTLSENVTTDQNFLVLKENFVQNRELMFSFNGEILGTTQRYFLVDNEIIWCNAVAQNRLEQCSRGRFGTTVSAHNANAAVFLLFRDSSTEALYLNPANPALREQSFNSFADTFKRLNFTMLYQDGDVYPWLYGRSSADMIRAENVAKGLLPYLQKLDKWPRGSHAGGGYWAQPSYNWYYRSDGVTEDGTAFKAKEFDRNWRVATLSTWSPYAIPIMNVGWRKIVGAELRNVNGRGIRDFDATTPDELDYILLKMLAYDSTLSLQLDIPEFADRHQKLDDLFSLIGRYNQLLKMDTESAFIPQRIKDYFQLADKEGELTTTAGWNFVEKKIGEVTGVWSGNNNLVLRFENPFASQRLRFELRPRFDYYQFGDSRHKTLVSVLSGLSTETSSSDVICSVSGNTVTVQNNGGQIGGCRIRIPGTFDLSNHRGVGLSLTGDGRNELVVVRLGNEFPVRDYKFVVDFADRREVILGDPTGDLDDLVNGKKTNWMETRKNRNWHFEFDRVDGVSIFINNVKAGSTARLDIHSLKALREKSGGLVNPILTVNGKVLRFPVTLAVNDRDPHILEFNGFTNEYRLYNSNYKLLETKRLTAGPGAVLEPMLVRGDNNLQVNSDLTGSESLGRATLRVFAYDDEDGDGVPTNGNYAPNYTPCRGGIVNFCDDNCPAVFNPKQEDSNADGVGDACGFKQDDRRSSDLGRVATPTPPALPTPPVKEPPPPSSDDDSNDSDDLIKPKLPPISPSFRPSGF